MIECKLKSKDLRIFQFHASIIESKVCTSEQITFYLEIQAVDVKGFFSEDIMVLIRSSNFVTKSLSQNFF